MHELLDALDIARHFEKDFDKAKMLALCIVDWARQESDDCPPQKLLEDSRKALKVKPRKG